MSRDVKAGANAIKRPSRTVFKSCCGYRAQQREIVMKIKGKAGTKEMRHATLMQKIMKLMQTGVVTGLNTGLTVFKRRMDRDKMEQLLEEEDPDEAMATIPWDKLRKDIGGVGGNLEKATIQASEQSIAVLPRPKSRFIVGTANPKIREFIDSQVGNLVVDITEESRKSIRNAVTQSFNQGLTPRQTASIMQQSVGMTEKQNIQLMNRQLKEFERRDRLQRRLSSLDAKGLSGSKSARKIRQDLRSLTDDRIQKRTEQFAGRLQKNRSITIARTELTRSVNQGQVETWLAAADEGLIDRESARKIWVVVPDDRLSNICADLDGKTVALNEKFFVNQTGAMVDGPPAHPNCRSAVSLVFEEE